MQKKLSLLKLTFILLLVLLPVVFFSWRFNRPEKIPSPTKKMSLSDLYLYAQKTKAMDEITSSEVYFSATKTQLDNRHFQINFYLSAKDGMKVDGADLVLNTSQNLIIKKITQGQVFPQYPRLVHDNQNATVTGLASLAGNMIKLGQPNRLFASLIVEKVIFNQPAKITIDQSSTKANLNGEAVLNQSVSLKEINL
ncbi:hypothetical protein A2459_02800 [Candidatus Roizmanbacteria bacterium RIFOXYC2_FULL_41_10]|nr:MAG: hypothetical protein A2459_02800 [Candidatus Roizmanbacteria bacterium RIFOXYC2_FULL_41_10]